MPNLKIKLAFILFCFPLLLTSCITETTGGFNADVSAERALDDYLKLSMGYLSQGDLVAARRHLNNASELDPNNSTAFGVWGLLYSVEGEKALADDSFRHALRIDFGNSQVRNNYAAFLFSNGNYKAAYEQLKIVVEDTEYIGRAQAFENMGLASLQLNNQDDAEYAFGRALQLSSNQMKSAQELTAIHLLKGNHVQANGFYTNLLTLIQFYNVKHSARSLWVGIQLEQAKGSNNKINEYAVLLEESFPLSEEYELYKQSMSSP